MTETPRKAGTEKHAFVGYPNQKAMSYFE